VIPQAPRWLRPKAVYPQYLGQGTPERAVKTVRIDHQRQVTVRQDGDHLTKSKADVALESTNFYATNLDLGA
jgi:hypothetical protein